MSSSRSTKWNWGVSFSIEFDANIVHARNLSRWCGRLRTARGRSRSCPATRGDVTEDARIELARKRILPNSIEWNGSCSGPPHRYSLGEQYLSEIDFIPTGLHSSWFHTLVEGRLAHAPGSHSPTARTVVTTQVSCDQITQYG